MHLNPSVRQFLERRAVLVPLALIIASASAFLIYVRLSSDYYDYWVFPRENGIPPYIYPELRYLIFDLVLIIWCLDGLIAAACAIRDAFRFRKISARTYRIALLYFVLFAALILDGTIMVVMRSHGI